METNSKIKDFWIGIGAFVEYNDNGALAKAKDGAFFPKMAMTLMSKLRERVRHISTISHSEFEWEDEDWEASMKSEILKDNPKNQD